MAKSSRGRILLVDDDPSLLRLLSIRLEKSGFTVDAVKDARTAVQLLQRKLPNIVITDLRMDEMDGMDLLKRLHSDHPSLPVLIMTAHGTIPDAVKAMQSGAMGFLTKPINREELLDHVENAMSITQGDSDDQEWREAIITRSPKMESLLAEAHQVARSNSSILITGSSGSGKELLANAIHRASNRADGPFVAINCGAIPEQLLESELFGHKKGSFTGATSDHQGLIQSANGGTLFLDEIGDMPVPLQVKLLRVLQEHKVRSVGDTRDVDVDVRIISATHRDLTELMSAGDFREDLFYRLNVVQLKLPPLKERHEDIPLLVSHFLQQFARRDKTAAKVYAPEAMELLVAAEWPGNIRQLANIVERNVALAPSTVITRALVEKALGSVDGNLPPLAEARDAFVRNYLMQLLQSTEGNVSQAARLAARNRTDFYKLLSKHDIDPQDFKTPAEPSSSKTK